MVHVQISAEVPGRSADEVYAILSDFSKYTGCSDVVRSIVLGKEDGRDVSTWEVNFRDGILCWKELDIYRPDMRSIQFQQIEGDVDYFAGNWSATEDIGGCRVAFEADFDLNLGELGVTIEPIAEAALRETVQSILSCLLGAVEFVHS